MAKNSTDVILPGVLGRTVWCWPMPDVCRNWSCAAKSQWNAGCQSWCRQTRTAYWFHRFCLLALESNAHNIDNDQRLLWYYSRKSEQW